MTTEESRQAALTLRRTIRERFPPGRERMRWPWWVTRFVSARRTDAPGNAVLRLPSRRRTVALLSNSESLFDQARRQLREVLQHLRTRQRLAPLDYAVLTHAMHLKDLNSPSSPRIWFT